MHAAESFGETAKAAHQTGNRFISSVKLQGICPDLQIVQQLSVANRASFATLGRKQAAVSRSVDTRNVLQAAP